MDKKRSALLAFLTGTPIGCLGGLIGLGGAEFRLPVLVGLFKFSARKAVALNIAISLITVLSSIIFRIPKTNVATIVPLAMIMVSIIAGSMTGAYFGADFSKKVTETLLKKTILILLVFIGCLLIFESFVPFVSGGIAFGYIVVKILIGVFSGLIIGFISSLLGVAGGELIIPTLILLFGVDVKLAGTSSLLISLPTMLIGISKHAANNMYADKTDFPALVLPMGIGSIIGAFIGAALVSVVPGETIKLLLGILLIFSAVKIFIEKKAMSSQINGVDDGNKF
ncbi:sulfite exporter TauE/SafE family protein [Desulfitobacterium sp. AusDCA]